MRRTSIVLLSVLSGVASAHAEKYDEKAQLTITKPDGTTVLARAYQSDSTGIWSTTTFVVEIDGMKEIVARGGFGHRAGTAFQSPDKREFVQMAAFEGGSHGGIVFDLLTRKSRPLEDSVWKDDLVKRGYTQLRWGDLRPQATTQPMPATRSTTRPSQ